MAVDRSQIPAWVAEYIGLPWQPKGRDRGGVDCWGLAWLVAAERFGLTLPLYLAGYDGAARADVEDIGRLVAAELGPWRPIVAPDPATGALAFGAERPGDFLLIRQHGHACHVGIVVAPGWMLHIEEGIDSVTVDYDGRVWRRRVVGVYRHARLA